MYLKEKSNFNILAADFLINKQSLYAPSVHCSYYACFQLMKVCLNSFFGMDYDTIDTNVASSNPKTSEHNYVRRVLLESIKENMGNEDFLFFSRKFKDMKQYRAKSDYKNVEIKVEDANTVYNNSLELIKYMKKTFHV